MEIGKSSFKRIRNGKRILKILRFGEFDISLYPPTKKKKQTKKTKVLLRISEVKSLFCSRLILYHEGSH